MSTLARRTVWQGQLRGRGLSEEYSHPFKSQAQVFTTSGGKLFFNASPICETKRIILNFAKEVGSPSAVDLTDYGTASGSGQRPGLRPAPLATALARHRL